jgi:thioredoxin 1
MVHQVKDMADFKAKLTEAGDHLVVVDFFATWCGPCKVIAPKLEALSTELKGSVMFLKVDVDEVEEVATEYGVSAMPTFMFFKKSQKLEEFSGANENKLKEVVNKLK